MPGSVMLLVGMSDLRCVDVLSRAKKPKDKLFKFMFYFGKSLKFVHEKHLAIESKPKLKISYVAVLLQLCLQQQEYDSSFWQLMLVAVPWFCLCLASSQRHVFLQQ